MAEKRAWKAKQQKAWPQPWEQTNQKWGQSKWPQEGEGVKDDHQHPRWVADETPEGIPERSLKKTRKEDIPVKSTKNPISRYVKALEPLNSVAEDKKKLSKENRRRAIVERIDEEELSKHLKSVKDVWMTLITYGWITKWNASEVQSLLTKYVEELVLPQNFRIKVQNYKTHWGQETERRPWGNHRPFPRRVGVS
jgi:hypothetical protein